MEQWIKNGNEVISPEEWQQIEERWTTLIGQGGGSVSLSEIEFNELAMFLRPGMDQFPFPGGCLVCDGFHQYAKDTEGGFHQYNKDLN